MANFVFHIGKIEHTTMICVTHFIICAAHIMKCVTQIIIVWLLLWNVCTHFISKNFHAHTTDCRQNITYISLICVEGKTQIIIVTQIIIRVFTQIIIVTQIIISRSGDFCSNTYHNNSHTIIITHITFLNV